MRKSFQLTDTILKAWLIGLIITGLSCGAVLQVYASSLATPAGMPVIQVAGVIPKGYVQLLISNLPASTEFGVTMGPAGSQGIGGLVAHFISPAAGGSATYWFEIENLVRDLSSGEVRIDSGNGYVAWATFDNTSQVIPITPTPALSATPAPTAVIPIVQNSNLMQLVHVQKGGLVVVLVRDLPLNQKFTVTIGKAGSGGSGGYVTAHIPSGNQTTNIAYFEIPVLLSGESALDLRIEGAGVLYIFTFTNLDF